MLFTDFIKYIPKILKEQLPALSAHIKMAPLERVASLDPDFYSEKGARQSAVMMLVYPKNQDAHFVLIKRNTYPGIHSSQISFPGGKEEPEDENLAQTALRETFEEVGIISDDIEVVMPFSQIYIPPSNFLVYPFLGFAGSELTFNPSPDEVAAIIEVPLDTLLEDSTVINTTLETSYAQSLTVPAFKIDEHMVWGATAMILSELKETIKSILK